MQAHELDGLLAQLRLAHTPAEKARLRRRVKDAQRERWFDRRCDESVQRIARETGTEVPTWRPPSLRVGETWVLLCGDGRGHVAPLTVHPRPLQRLASELRYELDRAFAGLLATLGRARRRFPHELHATNVEIGAGRLVGASLGVAACVGWMSRALNVPAAEDVVATAQVFPNGKLEPVEQLAAKLTALRESLPHVRKVVVATKQLEPEDTSGIELVRCEDLASALPLFGLSPSQLQAEVSAAHFEREHDAIKHLENENLGADVWLEKARHAQEIACGLASFGDEELREKAAQTLMRAALFALHGGDPAFAEDLLREASASALSAELAALLAVVHASKNIDVPGNKEKAVADARAAVALAEALDSKREKREVLGRAYGTLGRALMHADAFEEALPWLRKGAEFHLEHAAREYARSLAYVTQCLRGLDRQSEALQVVREASAFAADPRYVTAEKTKAYLRLEEGRALLASGCASEALDAFEYVVDCQADDADHPRISGLRGMAAALRALGQADAAQSWFDRCHAVAVSAHVPPILREVATLAIGDVLACEGDAAELPLWTLWTQFFSGYAAPERLCWRVRTYVY